MNDRELTALFSAIETPPCDLEGLVLSRLRAGRRRKRLVLVLAGVLAASLALIGARKLYEWQLFHPDGSVEEARIASSEAAVNTPGAQTPQAFIDPPDTSPGQLVITSIEGMLATSGIHSLDLSAFSGEELKAFVREADTKPRLPGYLPEGFALKECNAGFYVDAVWRDLKSDAFIDAGNGYYYQLFTMPQGWQKKLWALDLYYANAKGETLVIKAACTGRVPPALLGSGQARSETVKLEPFGQGSYVTDPERSEGKRSLLVSEAIPAFSYLEPFALGAGERKQSEAGGKRGKAQTCREISYTLSSDTLGKDALIKIAESLA